MNACDHIHLLIDATVTLYADKPCSDGSRVLGVCGELTDALVQGAVCMECDSEILVDDNPLLEAWLPDFYEQKGQ
jgi:hypothetical protein